MLETEKINKFNIERTFSLDLKNKQIIPKKYT